MLSSFGIKSIITSDKNEILSADKIIFPGQGHFAQVMEKLKETNLDRTIKEVIKSGKDFLGICVGFQVLFEKSEEAPGVMGLGIFKGEVKKYKQGKTPQIGWSEIRTTLNNTFLSNGYFYFVNSYYVEPKDPLIISSYANYHIDFCASVEYKNITAVQFHPEKSADSGIEFFKKWLSK